MLRKSKVSSVPINVLINDRDVLAALADVEIAKKREAELRNKTRIRRLKDTGKEWARLCSLHGIPHLAMARSWFAILLWLVVVLAVLSGFFYFLYYCVNSYLQYNTSVTINLAEDQVEFPSVTICNNSPYQASRFMQTLQLKGMLLLYRSLVESQFK